LPFSSSLKVSLVLHHFKRNFLLAMSPQCDRPLLQRDFIIPSCCPRASDAPIREPVDACFEQLENTSDQCKIHAYILITKKEAWCVDPRAWWLPNRLKMLERVSQTQSVILSIMFTWRFFKKKKMYPYFLLM
uniref:Chemokine interleukin-8-like domain-containing protein n=1 Tax=Takifugu rubripes TaxID=31033 RepID=A0A3B5K6T7_TAKRU